MISIEESDMRRRGKVSLVIRSTRRRILWVIIPWSMEDSEIKGTKIGSPAILTRRKRLKFHEIPKVCMIGEHSHRLWRTTKLSTPLLESEDNEPKYLIVVRESTFRKSKFERKERDRMKYTRIFRLGNNSQQCKTRTIYLKDTRFREI